MEDSNGGANGDTTLYSVRKSVCFKGTGHTKTEHSVFIYSHFYAVLYVLLYSESQNDLFAIFFKCFKAIR